MYPAIKDPTRGLGSGTGDVQVNINTGPEMLVLVGYDLEYCFKFPGGCVPAVPHPQCDIQYNTVLIWLEKYNL